MNVILRSAALIVAVQAAGIHGWCPLGSVQSAIDASICYKFVSAKRPFLDAEEACRQHHGHLASVSSGLANAFINDEALKSFGNDSDGYFIGANDLAAAGHWVWTDGSKFAYTHGGAGEPKHKTGLECVYIAIEDGVWHTGNCFSPRPSVCIVPQSNVTECPPVPTCPMYTAPPSPASTPATTRPTRTASTTGRPVPTTTAAPRCEVGWESFTSNSTLFCYRVTSEFGFILDAVAACAKWQSTLVSIHSADEDAFVQRLGTGLSYIWLGLHWTSGSNGKYIWIDGTPYGFSTWADQPARGDRNKCAMMSPKSGQWYYDHCDQDMAYSICKKPAQ